MKRQWLTSTSRSGNGVKPHEISVRTWVLSKLEFLGAFAKLRKATINFFMLVLPSAHVEQLRSPERIFMELAICRENSSFINI